MVEKRVIILGGGPAGLQATRRILEKTERVRIVLVEEHTNVGLPQHCTSLVSLRGLKEDIAVSERVVLNYFKGAYIYSPAGYLIVAERNDNVAAVINRPDLEQELLENVSRSQNVDIILGKKGRMRDNIVWVNGKRISGDIVVDARGISVLKRRRNLGNNVLPALQYDIQIENLGLESDHVYIFLGSRFSTGFFAWIVPLTEDTVRIGLASRGNVKKRLDSMLKEDLVKGLIKPIKVEKVLGGAVYTGGTVYPLVEGTTAYIGDSAGQTKPTTGGGLVYLSRAAKYLAEAIVGGDLRMYERLWKKNMNREIKIQRTLRVFLNNLQDKQLDRLFKTLKEIDVEDILRREGDMDFQSQIVKKIGLKILYKDPMLAALLLKHLLGSFIAAI